MQWNKIMGFHERFVRWVMPELERPYLFLADDCLESKFNFLAEKLQFENVSYCSVEINSENTNMQLNVYIIKRTMACCCSSYSFLIFTQKKYACVTSNYEHGSQPTACGSRAGAPADLLPFGGGRVRSQGRPAITHRALWVWESMWHCCSLQVVISGHRYHVAGSSESGVRG